MILVWGVSGDGPIQALCEALTSEGDAWLLIDQVDAARSFLSFEETDASDGWLIVGDERVELGSIKAVYPRPYESARVLRIADVTEAGAIEHAERFDDAMLAWLDQTEALVVNRPSAMTSNGSKPLQSALIASAGFAVPETLLTTDVEAAAAFRDRHGRVIYKSISGVRSRVTLLGNETLQRIRNTACALQLQEYVSGIDVRVHVLGGEVFACTIESHAVDYRYPMAQLEEPKIAACDLPEEIAVRCVELTTMLGLSFAGIDLRHAGDGRWICFEANPSPGYTFYEQASGAGITGALRDLLLRGQQERRRGGEI
jgi:glutathione synthase/RimK-type ligase-like ATP-grasp enzyme